MKEDFKIITCPNCGEEWSGNLFHGGNTSCNKCATKWDHNMTIEETSHYCNLYALKKHEGMKYTVDLNYFELDMIIRGLMTFRDDCKIEIFKHDDCISEVIGKLNGLKTN